MNTQSSNEKTTGSGNSSTENKDIKPLPNGFKQAGIGLVVLILIVLVYLIISNRSDESSPQVLLLDDEQSQESFTEQLENKTDSTPESLLPVHSDIALHQEVQSENTFVDNSLKSDFLAEKPEKIDSQLAELQELLNNLIADNKADQAHQDERISLLQAQLTAQELKIEQLKQNQFTAKAIKSKKRNKKRTKTRKNKITVPFTLVSIDQWGSDYFAIVRSDNLIYELTIDRALLGWRVVSINFRRGKVTLINEKGVYQELLLQS